MTLTIPDDQEIICWVCGSLGDDLMTVPIRDQGRIKGLIFACQGNCAKSLNLSRAKIDYIGNKEN